MLTLQIGRLKTTTRELSICCGGDAEHAAFRRAVSDERFDSIRVQDLVAVSEEVVEQSAYLVEGEHVFFLDEFACCHAPSPAFVCATQDGDHGDLEVVQSVGYGDGGLFAFGAQGSGEQVAIGVGEICV